MNLVSLCHPEPLAAKDLLRLRDVAIAGQIRYTQNDTVTRYLGTCFDMSDSINSL